jgi:hypothetical protein
VRPVVVEASAVVDAPQKRVFEVLADPAHFFALTPHAVEHRDIEPLPTGGHRCVQVFAVNGRRVEQRSTNLVYEPPRRLVDAGETSFGSPVQTAVIDPVPEGAMVRLLVEARPRRWVPLCSLLSRWGMKRQLRRCLRLLEEESARER